MMHYGQVLSLEDFPGPITIEQSNFERNQVHYWGICDNGALFFDTSLLTEEFLNGQTFS